MSCLCHKYILLSSLAEASVLCFGLFFFPEPICLILRWLSGPRGYWQVGRRAKDATCELQTSQLRVKETELIHFPRTV